MNLSKKLAVALIAITTSCASPLASLPPIDSAAPAAYQLGAGDEVRVTVVGFDTLTNTYTVSDAGSLSIPMLSAVDVRGKTPSELETLLATELERRELAVNPSVSVQVQKYRPFFILGEVQQPGQYPYVPGMTVLTAVSIAGGYTFRAEEGGAAITRQRDGQVVRGRATQQTLVLPGDTVYVYEDWF